MACTDCDKDGCKWGSFIMPCKVCELNNNDLKPKVACYCTGCKAYICKEHWTDAPARIEAALRNTGNVVYEKSQEIVESVKTFIGKRKKRNKNNNDGSPAAPTS